MRYNYYFNGNKIICVSKYAGKPVRAVAICSDEDEYDEVYGKDLARARVDLKIAEKKLKRSDEMKKYLEFLIEDLNSAYEEECLWNEQKKDEYCSAMRVLDELSYQST